MTLSMGRLRAIEERWMPDECVVTRNPGGVADDVYDRDTEQIIPGSAPVYSGRCALVAPTADRLSRSTVAESETAPVTLELRLPLSEMTAAREPKVGDLVVMSAAAYDPGLAGRTLRVSEVVAESFSTARVCMVRLV